MEHRPEFVPGEGPLSYGRVLREAWGMFQGNFWRVAVVAPVLFVPPPLLAAILEGWRDLLEADPGLIRGLGFLIGLLAATAIRLLGPVVYAGYLDEAVGQRYFKGHDVRMGSVLRELPWIRLIIAEFILVGGTTIGLAFFVIPGIIWLTLFALIGPVLVQERHGIRDGFRRTFQLSRDAWVYVLVMVVAFLALESAAHEIVHELPLIAAHRRQSSRARSLFNLHNGRLNNSLELFCPTVTRARDIQNQARKLSRLLLHCKTGQLLQRLHNVRLRQGPQIISGLTRHAQIGAAVLHLNFDVAVEVGNIEELFEVVGGKLALVRLGLLCVLSHC